MHISTVTGLPRAGERLTSIQSVRKRVDQVFQSRNHLDLGQDVTVNTVAPLEQFKELLLNLWRCDIVWVKFVGFTLFAQVFGLACVGCFSTYGKFGEEVLEIFDVAVSVGILGLWTTYKR